MMYVTPLYAHCHVLVRPSSTPMNCMCDTCNACMHIKEPPDELRYSRLCSAGHVEQYSAVLRALMLVKHVLFIAQTFSMRLRYL
jgi:hypothetical protein